MATINLNDLVIHTSGNLPKNGTKAPEFELVAGDLSRKTLADFKGSKLVLNIFPSLDTGTCASSVRAFNKSASGLENTKVLCISRDLPFAHERFCAAEGLKDVVMLSDFVSGAFGDDYGLKITDGPIKDLSSRCVIVLDENGTVIYSEQVQNIPDEPNYEAALNALK
ncbi:MAG: thiol peroxidase [Flavobacteriaceae bacterium]|nr:thiol peroxidase [Flavobacteriaceae bacterium]